MPLLPGGYTTGALGDEMRQAVELLTRLHSRGLTNAPVRFSAAHRAQCCVCQTIALYEQKLQGGEKSKETCVDEPATSLAQWR